MELETGQFPPVINKRGFKRTVPMEVLCLGLSRSGTTSLFKALQILGIPTYHGYNTSFSHWDCILWREATESKYCNKGKIWTREDFDQILGDYSATTDLPSAGFVTELIKAYPEAKVILNKRPYESWRKSYLTAFQEPLIENWSFKMLMLLDWESRTIYNYWCWYLEQILFRGSFRRNSKQVYDEHYALVRGAAPKDKFLEWDVTQGWEPLCEFLGKPVPDQEFPNGNKVDEFLDFLIGEAFMPRIKRGVRKCVIGAVVAASLGGVLATNYLRPGFLQKTIGGFGLFRGRL